MTELAAYRKGVQRAHVGFAVSQRRACRTLGVSPATVRYHARGGNDQRLRGLLRELAQKRLCFGYRWLATMLRCLGERVNLKRVYRLYCEELLLLRRKTASQAYPKDSWSDAAVQLSQSALVAGFHNGHRREWAEVSDTQRD